MQLSVVILNYNVRFFLELCLDSVFRAIDGIAAEVIVVDNNSPDDSCEMVRRKFPQVKLIANEENLGFPKGNNIGVAAASGKYICILNPDTVVGEDTFIKLLKFSGEKSGHGIIGVKMIDGTGKFLPESKRGVPTPFSAACKMIGFDRLFPHNKKLNTYYASYLNDDETGAIEILPGSFMFMQRDLYENAGGFDERYFMYGEDIDLSYSVLKVGRQNYYFPETAIIHFKGESTVKDKAYQERFSSAMQLFYNKHFNGSKLFAATLKIAAVLFTKRKAQKHVSNEVPSRYILFSGDEVLRQKLNDTLQKKVDRFDAYDENVVISQTFSDGGTTGVIFDAGTQTYAEIIAVMQRHKHSGFAFRIKPNRADFVLGSDSSDSRGEVIRLD